MYLISQQSPNMLTSIFYADLMFLDIFINITELLSGNISNLSLNIII